MGSVSVSSVMLWLTEYVRLVRLELDGRNKVELLEVLPRPVVKPEGRKRGIFRVHKVPIIEACILRLVH